MTDEATSWWPSPFGRGDEPGMLNHITDGTRVAALGLVRSGRMCDLGRVLDQDVPRGATGAWTSPIALV